MVKPNHIKEVADQYPKNRFHPKVQRKIRLLVGTIGCFRSLPPKANFQQHSPKWSADFGPHRIVAIEIRNEFLASNGCHPRIPTPHMPHFPEPLHDHAVLVRKRKMQLQMDTDSRLQVIDALKSKSQVDAEILAGKPRRS
jgi:hypothetical protein